MVVEGVYECQGLPLSGTSRDSLVTTVISLDTKEHRFDRHAFLRVHHPRRCLYRLGMGQHGPSDCGIHRFSLRSEPYCVLGTGYPR